ncbi:MAG: hypothetical protein ACLTYN_12245 [Dysosmobacter welbionis]
MNQGLSPNTVIKHYVMLTTALGMAVRLEMLERSPMDRVTPPKKKEARFSFYSPEQLQLLFSAVSGTMMELPVKLAAYLACGAARSAACGGRMWTWRRGCSPSGRCAQRWAAAWC